MFLGHFALGLGAKRVVPTVSLGVLFLACQLADLIWPSLVLVGVEHVWIDPGNTAFTPLAFVSYPYSHSLVALAGWAVLAGVVYMRATGAGALVVLSVSSLVLSHWVLDWISHRPDMPITPRGHLHVGLGLWNSIPGTIVVEATLFAVGLGVYVRTTRARDRIGSVGLWSLVATLALIYVANIFSPPPPSSTAVAWAANGMWLFVIWAFWADRHRA